MPLGMLAGLHVCKAKIDSDIAAAEAKAQKARDRAAAVKGKEAEYLNSMCQACTGSAAPDAGQLEEMQAVFDCMPEDLRNSIYQGVCKDAGHDESDVPLGKGNLFADLARFVKVVTPSVVALFEANRKARREEEEAKVKQAELAAAASKKVEMVEKGWLQRQKNTTTMAVQAHQKCQLLCQGILVATQQQHQLV